MDTNIKSRSDPWKASAVAIKICSTLNPGGQVSRILIHSCIVIICILYGALIPIHTAVMPGIHRSSCSTISTMVSASV